MEVATHKYRFRVLNGSNARPFQLAPSNAGHSAKVKTSTSGWLDQDGPSLEDCIMNIESKSCGAA
jgi:FtsP/CotA-like multicopper oxidase with cupredoxin domain